MFLAILPRSISPPSVPRFTVTRQYVELLAQQILRPRLKNAGCGRMFIPELGKQKHCTKSCARTSRWRRCMARQNAG